MILSEYTRELGVRFVTLERLWIPNKEGAGSSPGNGIEAGTLHNWVVENTYRAFVPRVQAVPGKLSELPVIQTMFFHAQAHDTCGNAKPLCCLEHAATCFLKGRHYQPLF